MVLVEITSNSTEEYDRGEKLWHYQQISSAREILIVSHREPHLTMHRREGDAWIMLDARPGQTVALSAIAARLMVDDVYRDGLEDTSAS